MHAANKWCLSLINIRLGLSTLSKALLLAKGISYTNISKELNVSRRSVINWYK
ncbi:helix-turn-helix domain-containing protein [Acinetobacter tandoii]|uniref:Helix-turn-helix domain-containing protein n=1 Tax=Acinetobacter tandoii TaxID=202954 RepID=A0A5N4W5W9_9GAMM|nr:helix-turn-helix domain-containing protein [Acinetobacter tandoii]